MESLYVCLFSNGHIKVGRSINPESRIASHAERVACMGVELIDWSTYDAEEAERRELILIDLCAAFPGATRFKSEWFSGLEFGTVCEWARITSSRELSPQDSPDSAFGRRLREARCAAGLTQSDLGEGLATDGGDLLKAAISAWELGRCSPNVQQLTLICRRLNVSADKLLGLQL